MAVPHLVFTLYAAHGAWGAATLSSANKAWRATELDPGLSHICGILGAALGLPRSSLGMLAETLWFGSRALIQAQRDVAPDYHTITSPTPPTGRDHCRGWTRFEELRPTLSPGRGPQGSVQSWREYWTHGLWLVVLRRRDDDTSALDKLGEALRRPCHPLFAGRKSCPLGLPPDPEIVAAAGPLDALARYGTPWHRHPELVDRLGLLPPPGPLLLDADFPDAPARLRLLERRDRPLPAGSRLFGLRSVAECREN